MPVISVPLITPLIGWICLKEGVFRGKLIAPYLRYASNEVYIAGCSPYLRYERLRQFVPGPLSQVNIGSGKFD